MSRDVEVESYQGSDLRRETGWWGAFVVGLAEAGLEAALGEFRDDASSEFCDCSEDLEGQDAVV